MEIKYELLTLIDAIYILSNNKGYFDADQQCVVIK